VTIGNIRRPSPFTVNDHRLRSIHHGLTPATIELDLGVYEVVVRHDGLATSRVIVVEQGAYSDVPDLGLPVATEVPVANACARDQFAAETVSMGSSRLRDSPGSGGLLVIGLLGGSNGMVTQPSIALVDGRGVTVEPVILAFRGSVGWWSTARLKPGGYILQLSLPGEADEAIALPVWLSDGFQSIVFFPLAPSHIDRASVHMTPAASVWTGFDHATVLLESALANLRRGERPFGETTPSVDIVTLCHSNPILGLVRAYDLCVNAPDSAELRRLISYLAVSIPGHPDLEIIRGSQPLSFPPMLATGVPVSLGYANGRQRPILPGSLLEVSYAFLTRFGPWNTWTVGDNGLSRDERFDVGPSSVGGSLNASLSIYNPDSRYSRYADRVLIAVILIAGWLAARPLSKLQDEELAAFVRRPDLDPAVRRISLYLVDLVSLGRKEQARRLLTGVSIEHLSEATMLPPTIVVHALVHVHRELRRASALSSSRRHFRFPFFARMLSIFREVVRMLTRRS
jgi:hypothetical protein